MNTALLLIDLQNEWRNPNSDYYVGDCKEYIAKINTLLHYGRQKDFKIIVTRHVETEGTAFQEGNSNAFIMDEIRKDATDSIIIKNKINPFYKTNLETELTGVEKIIIAGILTNLCVRMAVEECYDREFTTVLVDDCCLFFNSKIHSFTLNDLKETREEISIFKLKNLI